MNTEKHFELGGGGYVTPEGILGSNVPPKGTAEGAVIGDSQANILLGLGEKRPFLQIIASAMRMPSSKASDAASKAHGSGTHESHLHQTQKVHKTYVRLTETGIQDEILKIYMWMVLLWKPPMNQPKKRFNLSSKELSQVLNTLEEKGLIKMEKTRRMRLMENLKVKILDTPIKREVLEMYSPKVIQDDYLSVHSTYVDVLVKLVHDFSPVGLKEVAHYLNTPSKELLKVARLLDEHGLIQIRQSNLNSVLLKPKGREFPEYRTQDGVSGREVAEKYSLHKDDITVDVIITMGRGEYKYNLAYPLFMEPTMTVMNRIYDKASPNIEDEINIVDDFDNIRSRLLSEIKKSAEGMLPTLDEKTRRLMLAEFTNELHLGKIEYLLKDPYIEEIKAQSGKPIFIKHVKCRQEWIETNITLSDASLYKHAKAIARETRQQIDSSHPLMDAVLHTGDRVNVSLPEIAGGSIVLEIRVFSKSPWNFVRLIKRGTVSADILAFIWLAIQNKFNILVSGETGSGKTSFVNALCIFLPKNDHIISVEDTRELLLPSFFKNWSHMTTRGAENRGGVTMAKLLVNSLRMNPSFIIMGEVRNNEDIETLMRATAMGHPVISTIHTRDCMTTIKRFEDAGITPNDLAHIHLNIILEAVKSKEDMNQSKRRVKEVGEYVLSGKAVEVNRIFRLDMNTDTINMINKPLNYHQRIMNKINFTKDDITVNLEEKKRIIEWLVSQNIDDIEVLGQVIQYYYHDPQTVVEAATKGIRVEALLQDER